MRHPVKTHVLVTFHVEDEAVSIPIPRNHQFDISGAREALYRRVALIKLHNEVGLSEWVLPQRELQAWEGKGKDRTKK
jgi:hypothetical protein